MDSWKLDKLYQPGHCRSSVRLVSKKGVHLVKSTGEGLTAVTCMYSALRPEGPSSWVLLHWAVYILDL